MSTNHLNEAFEGSYFDEQAIWLKSGTYEAAVLPGVGANMVVFRDKSNGYAFLRAPAKEEMEGFKSRPILHGIPVLFPPNRFEDGAFYWKGKTYSFPINEKDRNNHLHGFLHNIPWNVEQFSADAYESFVTLSLTIDRDHKVYTYFPHSFTIKLRYTLSENGLFKHVFVQNHGSEQMPCLLAFHTALNAPFDSDSLASDYTFKMTIGERYEMTDRMLPTGEYQPLTSEEKQMQGKGLSPFFESMDNHYTAVPQDGRNRMELTDHRTQTTLVYDIGASFKHWMIWNNGATEGFFCPEPQTSMVNAPQWLNPSTDKSSLDKKLTADQMGIIALNKGEIWEETCRIYVK